VARNISNLGSKFCCAGIYGYFWLLFSYIIPIQISIRHIIVNGSLNVQKFPVKECVFFLNSVNRKFSLSREAQVYIKKYHITHKKALKEAKKEIMIGISKR
jgi:hypothetical protein